ncbi:MAG: outer membrane protein assembly factor BamA [Treponema sp.]|jgi:outer membrane protein insertion porin family|nr:outer membrane protein assembly factor BamA [Treponema sp.]
MRRCFVIFSLVLAAYSSFVTVSPCSAQEDEWYLGKPIREIVFSGLRHASPQDLEGILAAYMGQEYSYELVEELQMRLYATGFFELLSPSTAPSDSSRSGLILRFTVTEQPVISRISFVGNSHVRQTELLDAVTLKPGDRAEKRRVGDEEQAVINKYLEKGYTRATVRSEIQVNAQGEAVIIFFISEGTQNFIQEFRFNGNTVFSDRTLRGQLSLKAKGLINDGAFQEAKLIADIQSITQYYRDRGYIDAEVRDVPRTEVVDDKGNAGMILTFDIHEGSRFTFGGISFSGNHIFSSEQLEDQVYSKIGDDVRVSRLEADLQRIADLYFESGYIFNTINREEERDQDKKTVFYKIEIIERGRAHIESIRVEGLDKTRKEVVLREIPLEPGDVFSKTKVADGLRNLYNLQFFSAIIPETEPGSSESLMDLVFRVEEQPTTDIQFGVTFSGTSDPGQFPISGMLRINDRNFRGTGNSLGAEINASPDTQSLAFNYTHRYIFGLPLSLGTDLSISHTQRLTPMDNIAPFFYGNETYAYPDGFDSYEEFEKASSYPSEFLMRYNQWYFSLGLSTGYRWNTFLGILSTGVGMRAGIILNAYDANLYRPLDYTIRRDNNRPTPANSVWASVSLDQRDIYYDPSDGYFGSQRFGIYGILPMEREKYIRSDTKAEYFYTLVNIPVGEHWSFKLIAGVHSGLSFIFKQPGEDMPIIENANKLAVDGMFIARGWNADYRVKGLALWDNWAELRIPLVPGVLAWDFFFDVAGVSPTPREFFTGFDLDIMRYSLGGGLRFTIPQFPLRFSFAKRFRTVDGKVQWEEGSIGKNGPGGGLDWVLSFAISY